MCGIVHRPGSGVTVAGAPAGGVGGAVVIGSFGVGGLGHGHILQHAADSRTRRLPAFPCGGGPPDVKVTVQVSGHCVPPTVAVHMSRASQGSPGTPHTCRNATQRTSHGTRHRVPDPPPPVPTRFSHTA